MSLGPGEMFAGYRIVRRIGSGGMGVVYLAEHPRLPRRDALKVLSSRPADDAEFRARFQREAELASRLEHPNVVAIYDRGSENGVLWIAMRYVDGVDAAELIRRGPAHLPPARTVGIIAAAARGLDAAHRGGLLHRDVKPANILVATADDGSDAVRITDFGIARTLDSGVDTLITVGSTPASFAYAAPEQLTDAPLDHRVDVYALGCTLYQMLTGSAPFGRRAPGAMLHAHLYEPPPRPSAAVPGLSAALDEVVARAMAKNPGDRYASCGELAAAAARALEGFAGPAPYGQSPDPARARVVAPARAAEPVRFPPFTPPPFPQATAEPPSGPPPASPAFGSGSHSPAAPRRGMALALVAVAAVLVVGLIAVVAVRLTAGDSDPSAVPLPSTPPTAWPTSTVSTTGVATSTTTTAPASAAWGPAAYIVAAFPRLLPADPESTGYQGMRCALNDDRGAWLHCPSADDDGISVNIRCDPSKRAVTYGSELTGRADLREQRWHRPSGSGSVRWATDNMAGFGLLDVAFDDADRNFCTVGASGGRGGQDVFDRWWVGAPI